MIVYKKTEEWYIEWQWVTTSGTTSENGWQPVTANDKEWCNEWQQLVQRATTSDNEWQKMTRSDKEWYLVTTSDNQANFQLANFFFLE